ncbi:hypothetical protein BJX70DRAFT_226403 [Aspergillus crustosus]
MREVPRSIRGSGLSFFPPLLYPIQLVQGATQTNHRGVFFRRGHDTYSTQDPQSRDSAHMSDTCVVLKRLC